MLLPQPFCKKKTKYMVINELLGFKHDCTVFFSGNNMKVKKYHHQKNSNKMDKS
jgi:hypothetical protein